jgi:hypothetical protein
LRILKWIGVVLGAAVIVCAVLALRMRARMKGPSPPVCAQPALARKTFSAPVQISGPSTAGARRYDIEPMAALASSGVLAIVYNVRDTIFAGTSGLATASIDLEGHVETRHYPSDRAEAFDAWMAASDDGKLRMVWLGHDGGSPERNMKIGYSESADGLIWSAPTEAYAPGDCPEGTRGCMDKPMIAAGKGSVYAIYYSEPGNGLRVARDAPDARGFRASSRVDDATYADVELTPSGRLFLAYVRDADGDPPDRYGDPRNTVLIAWSEDGARSFVHPIRASAEGEPIPFYFSNPQIRVDESRHTVYVVYPTGSRDGRWSIRLATSKDDGRSWTRIPVNDDAPCATHMTPRAALDPQTGRLHVTWVENRSGAGVLAYAVCEAGGERCGKNEAVSEPFASFSFERHLPAWLSEYGALVVDAERRRLYAVWTQPVMEAGEPTSRIFYALARLE